MEAETRIIKSNPFMGMYLSKYSMLNALGYGSDSNVLPETLKILQRYKLKALIIHDPVAHPEFHNELKNLFDRLDYITGRDLLFFCLVDPPEKKTKFEDRDYFGIWEPDILLNPSNAYNSNDASLTTYSLSQSLCIDYSKLPVILLTNDFQSKNFVIVQTASDILEKQLLEIGLFCAQKDHIHFEDNEFKTFIKSICFQKEEFKIKLESSLAQILTDFISFIVANSSSKDRNTAIHQSLITVEKQYKDSHQIDDIESYEKNNISFLGNLIKLYKPIFDNNERLERERQKTNENRQLCEVIDNLGELHFIENELENESKIIYRTYSQILPIYDKIIPLLDSHKKSYEAIDYSPLAISLGKIFEIEVNLSIVQWIRKHLDIEMPLYFNKFKESNNSYTIAPIKEGLMQDWIKIDFNQGNQYKYFAPNLGATELIMSQLYEQGIYPKSKFNDFNSFLKNWHSIRKYRNKAAHNNILSSREFHEMKSVFDLLTNKKYFHNMVQLKKSLRVTES